MKFRSIYDCFAWRATARKGAVREDFDFATFSGVP